MSTRRKSRVVRQSWAAYDALIEKAFAKHDTPTATPTSSIHPLEPNATDNAVDSLWEKVWELKARALEALPSKVESLEVAEREARRSGKQQTNAKAESAPVTPKGEVPLIEKAPIEKAPRLKRKSRWAQL